MNLVKLQDDLKMLPMAALQAKAQGQDPQVPPWLATSVLNERMDAQKKASLSQGAQGPQPSIAEQISQKAGLMALQGQQQQQAQQQMMNQMAQAPQPASENVPQPEPQPEPQMMAQGGLARLPVDSRMFNYRKGGIIGFAERGEVPDAEKEKEQTKADREAIAQLWNSIKSGSEYAGRAIADIASIIPRGLVGAYDTAVVRPMKAAGVNAAYLSPMLTPQGADVGSATPFTDVARKRDAAPQPIVQEPSVPPEAGDMGARDRGLPAALPKAAPPPPPPAAAPRPRVAPAAVAPTVQRPTQPPAQQPPAGIAALPAAQQQSPIETARGISAAFPVTAETPSVEAFLAEKNKFREASGAKRAGEPQQQQIDAYQAESARIRKERERSDAIAALSGYGRLGELAQRSAAISQRNILADTIRNDATEAMRVAMEGMKQAEAEGNMTKYAALKKEATDAQNTRANANALAASKIAGDQLQAATTQRGQDITAATAAAQNVSAEAIAKARDETAIKVANIGAAVSREAKAQGLGTKEIQAAEAAYARDPRAQAIKKMLESPMYSMGVEGQKRAQPLIAELEQIQRSKYTQFGATLEPSPGAKAPASTPGANTRMKFDAKGNPI